MQANFPNLFKKELTVLIQKYFKGKNITQSANSSNAIKNFINTLFKDSIPNDFTKEKLDTIKNKLNQDRELRNCIMEILNDF